MEETPAHTREQIHVVRSAGLASAQGWHALYKTLDNTKEITKPLACWVLLDTRATKVEVPNTPPIPVTMGMIVIDNQYRLAFAPSFPDWAFQRYLSEDEHDDWIEKQANKS